jgi:hypothetical protein
MARWRMPPESSCAWLRSRSGLIPTISISSALRSYRSCWESSGRWARSMSSNWAPTLITGLRALSALWKTTEIPDQRSLRSSSGPTRNRSTGVAGPSSARGREWKMTSPEVITPGVRSRRSAAIARVDLPLPLSPARPSTWPRRSTRSQPTTACTAWSPKP